MKCGVKFCGGCNPRFERGEVYRSLKKEIERIDFSHADEENQYDILLVIGGCQSCCASYEQYDVKGDIYKIWDLSQVDAVREKLAEL